MKACGRCGNVHSSAEEVRSCYNRPMPERTPVPSDLKSEDRATTKQVAFAQKLLDQLIMDPQDTPSYITKDLDQYGKREISTVIDRLMDDVKTAPKIERPTVASTPAPIEDGMYRTADGSIYKVQHALHGSGRQYAKKLRIVSEPERDDEGDIVLPGKIAFDYAPGVIYKLTEKDRMTMEQASEFGALYGTCVRCGRTLTKEKSIERSMGPVCAGKI